MFGEDFDNLNAAFQDLGAWVEAEDPPEWEEEEEEEEDFLEAEDDFPLSLEYDEGESDMYADGDFFVNDPGDW